MNKPRHSWISQNGFRIAKCSKCGITKKWDAHYGKIIYFKENGAGPFYRAPECRIVISTDILIKM
jgi:hypothetical protein